MKKTTILALAIFISVTSFAQNGEIIHEVINSGKVHTMSFDFDHYDDCYGESDLTIGFGYLENPSHPLHLLVKNEFYNEQTGFWDKTPWCYVQRVPLGDTLGSQLAWICHDAGQIMYADPITTEEYIYTALRHRLPDGNYCYGWIYYKAEGGDNPNELASHWVTFYEYAYCTESGYPLRVGQTSYGWNAEENSHDEPTIHPNPSEGVFTVSGEDVKEVEVYNALGQQILTQLVNGGTANIDLESQPAGFYFVNVTDQNGKRCVKKVVKR